MKQFSARSSQKTFSDNTQLQRSLRRYWELRTGSRELSFPYQATAIAVATRFAIASGSRNFQPKDISWS